MEEEKNYIIFMLAHDFLHSKLKYENGYLIENDIAYDICNNIANEFIKSKEYKNTTFSLYESLENWCENNKNLIDNRIKNNDTTRVLENIEKEFNKIQTRENTSNALDFINEIIYGLKNTYNI